MTKSHPLVSDVDPSDCARGKIVFADGGDVAITYGTGLKPITVLQTDKWILVELDRWDW